MISEEERNIELRLSERKLVMSYRNLQVEQGLDNLKESSCEGFPHGCWDDREAGRDALRMVGDGTHGG